MDLPTCANCGEKWTLARRPAKCPRCGVATKGQGEAEKRLARIAGKSADEIGDIIKRDLARRARGRTSGGN